MGETQCGWFEPVRPDSVSGDILCARSIFSAFRATRVIRTFPTSPTEEIDCRNCSRVPKSGEIQLGETSAELQPACLSSLLHICAALGHCDLFFYILDEMDSISGNRDMMRLLGRSCQVIQYKITLPIPQWNAKFFRIDNIYNFDRC